MMRKDDGTVIDGLTRAVGHDTIIDYIVIETRELKRIEI